MAVTTFADVQAVAQYKDVITVMIAEPIAGYVEIQAHDNRVEFYGNLARTETEGKYKFLYGTTGRLTIGYAREIFCEQCLASGVDYILWVDSDMILPADLFTRLIRHDVDVVSPLTFMRVPPFWPVMYKAIQHADETQFAIDDGFQLGELRKVDSIGFGTVLMRTKVLERVNRPWFMTNGNVGEDIQFGYRLTQAGIPVYVDCSTQVGHLADPPIVTHESYRSWKEKKCLEVRYVVPQLTL